MSTKNYLIIGSYGASNIGDEAMLSIILKELSPKGNLYVLSGNPEDTKKRHQINKVASHFPFGIRSFFSFSWIQSFQFLKKSDLVLLGGGGLFTDDYTQKAVMLWTWHVFLCKIFQKKVVLFANSVGPLKTKIGKNLARWAINSCSQIIVRDEISAQSVRELLPNREVTVGADLVFLNDFTPFSQKQNTKRLTLNLRHWNINFLVFSHLIDFCLQQGYEVVLIPTEKLDEILLRPLIRDRVMLVIPENFQEMIEILSTCEKAVGMRLHFLIAAALAGCKVFGIAYSSKVRGVLESLELPFIETRDYQDALKNPSRGFVKNAFFDGKKAKNLEIQKEKVKQMFDIV